MVVRLLENKHELTANKSTQSNIGDGDQEAKQWKNYVDVLKQTVDSMREICMAKQNILGCEVCFGALFPNPKKTFTGSVDVFDKCRPRLPISDFFDSRRIGMGKLGKVRT